MIFKQEDFDRAGAEILGTTLSQNVLAQLNTMIDAGGAKSLLASMIANIRATGETQEGAVVQTMRALERLLDASRPVACALMANLLPLASNLRLHNIFDAIDLWIAQCDSGKLTNQLKELARSEANPSMRKHYEWLMESRK